MRVFLIEPSPTQFDLRFQLLKIPVRVHPLFWLTAILLGGLDSSPQEMLVWMAVVFVSILVHEFGHALVMRHYGQVPRVVLYMFGGLATSQSDGFSWGGGWSAGWASRLSTFQQIRVLLAGPGAGFLLAALTLAMVKLTGGEVRWQPRFPVFWTFRLAIGNPEDYWLVYLLVFNLVYVNVWWGILNLLPVYPLDGGQIVRELCIWRDPWRGVVLSLWISFVVAFAVAVWATLGRELFLAILFGMLAWQSYLMLQHAGGGWR